MKTKSKRLAIIICALCVCLVIISFNAFGGNSVVGTWKVNGYEYDGKTYKTSNVAELCELRGYSFLEWNDASLIFTNTGTVYLHRTEEGTPVEVSGTYTVGDTFIELCSDGGEKKLLSYNIKNIYYDIPSGVTLVFQK